MKTTIAVLSCLLIITAAQNKQETDLQKANLKGPVHTVRVYKESGGHLQLSDITTYNSAGNVIEQIQYENGTLKVRSVYEYQESGKLNDITLSNDSGIIKKIRYTYNGNDIIKQHYNASGDLLYKEIERDDGISYYDKDGNLTQQTRINKSADGKKTETGFYLQSDDKAGLAKQWTLLISESGNQTELNFFNSSDTDTGKSISTRNNDGSVLEIADYDVNGTLTNKRIVKRGLDSYGNWTLENIFEQDLKTGALKLIKTASRTITYY